ncbi:tRNA modification GTPase GTPBP3, mitochondrial [Phlebotomus argentipes]|uniref:tRNA modification GTPase GTPBP3, mitochondrial n=1 Tax=Phlebotomus argentipes TaxID=94469 RepID=UPI0028932483|nr:tRNA modification GTPase GTPBP3, mitochondrial [Phlebotomus argentipes]
MLIKLNTLYSCGVKLFRNRYYSTANTIYSLSSGQGRCGVAVIRVSGSASLTALKSLASFKTDPMPRNALVKKIFHPTSREFIDRGLILWFPGPASFTGEDSCEFHVHGGRAVVAAILDALGSVPGLRPAAPGEFTKRAFYSGKMDLTEAEGIADLIHAETEMQRKQALMQANGLLSKKYNSWREKLKGILAHFEAFIDFAEDENFDDAVLRDVERVAVLVEREMKEHIEDGRKGEILRQGVRAAIVGAPNVGKSSFMNILAQRPVSIVTDIAGTTRDIVEVGCNVSGYPVVISDTAGLRRRGSDIVEDEGMSRARECAKYADFTIILLDATQVVHHLSQHPGDSLQHFIDKYLREMEIEIHSSEFVYLINKTDLISEVPDSTLPRLAWISCKTSAGLATAIDELQRSLQKICGEPSAEHPVLSQARHRHLLCEALIHLATFRDYVGLLAGNSSVELDFAIVAEEIRRVIQAIGKITGAVTTDEILDVIFKDFCIGK